MRSTPVVIDGVQWMVTTPFYVGSKEDVDLAVTCLHKAWTKELQETKEGNVMIMERCLSCVAKRGRYRKISGP